MQNAVICEVLVEICIRYYNNAIVYCADKEIQMNVLYGIIRSRISEFMVFDEVSRCFNRGKRVLLITYESGHYACFERSFACLSCQIDLQRLTLCKTSLGKKYDQNSC